jgi:general stress protein 26
MVESQIEISYEELEQEFLKAFADLGSEDLGTEGGILATSQDNHVTARRMRLLSDGFTLSGWTARGTRKAQQIMANPNVSVVVGYIQIDGVASVKGHPTDEPEFLELIRKKLPHRYESLVKNWSEKRDRVVIEIKPKRIALFKYPDPEAGIVRGVYILNVDERKAYSIPEQSLSANRSDIAAYWV